MIVNLRHEIIGNLVTLDEEVTGRAADNEAWYPKELGSGRGDMASA